MEAPVAVGEVTEEELVEGVAVELDEGGFGVIAGSEVAEAGLEFGDEESGEAAGEGEGRDAGEDVAAAEGVVVDFATPLDVGFKGDLGALGAHGIGAGLEDFLIEGVEHVDAEVEPIAAEVVTGGEASELGFLFKQADVCAEFEGGVGGVESAGSAAKDGEVICH